MDTDFNNPSLNILFKISAACNNGNFDTLKTHLIENEMGYLYKSLCISGIMPDERSVYEKIIVKNDEDLKEIENTEDEEGQNNLLRNKLKHMTKVGDLENLSLLSEQIDVNTSLKMDVILSEIRFGLILKKNTFVNDRINKGLKLVEKNCDWDRRNKFKVYQGLIHMLKNEFKQAAELFSATLATFQCDELFSYEQFVNYTIFCSLIAFDRKNLNEKILKSNDIIGVKSECENAYGLVQSIQSCYYNKIFAQMIKFCDEFITDVLIGEKITFFMDEIKIRSYSQLLESYSSINMKSMADAFVISEEYLENDLNQYIVNERLSCMIDKIDNMVLVKECERTFTDKIQDLSNQILNYVEKQANK